VCAANVQTQFQKAAAQQISWSRKSWNFAWPQAYPPQNVRPLDVFDGDPKYTLGIPDTHVQGFVRTNSRLFPYAGSHSHKSKGGIFVIKQGANGQQFLSSLHKTTGRHPSGVQVIGKYLIYGEGSRLFIRDIESQSQSRVGVFSAKGANFGSQYMFSENMSLVTECGTGDVYAIHTTGDEKGVSMISGKGYWRLSKLVTDGKALGLTAINAFSTRQDIKRCNLRASATKS